MSKQVIALAAATVCAGLGIYAVSLALRRVEPAPIFTWAYGLFAASVGFLCWVVLG